jgi:hypothetical protein
MEIVSHSVSALENGQPVLVPPKPVLPEKKSLGIAKRTSIRVSGTSFLQPLQHDKGEVLSFVL